MAAAEPSRAKERRTETHPALRRTYGGGRGPVSVIVAAADAALRAGITAALPAPEFSLVAECQTATATAAAAARHRPDVCVVDVDVPGGGIGAAASLARLDAPPVVLLLARSAEHEQLLAALRAGAAGYLVLGDVGREQLADDVRALARGDAALSRTAVTALVVAIRSGGETGSELTRREAEVIALLRDGLATKQIAQRLAIDPTTVRRHLSSALHKLGAPDRRTALQLLANADERRERR